MEQAKAAVAGIALGPGYFIAYTAGRAQIETLLAEYRAKAGAGASLRDFHDRLLCYGSTPLSIIGPELLADLAKPLADARASVKSTGRPFRSSWPCGRHPRNDWSDRIVIK